MKASLILIFFCVPQKKNLFAENRAVYISPNDNLDINNYMIRITFNDSHNNATHKEMNNSRLKTT